MTKIIVANDKGGVGKSLVAQFCIVAAQGAGQMPRIVEYDRQPKLSRIYGRERVHAHSVGPDLATQEADHTAMARFWDPMLAWLTDDRPMVTDFGAQVWSYFSQWARHSQLSRFASGEGVVLLVPATADPEALAGAARVVEEAPAILPQAKIIVLFCDKDGLVEGLEGTPAYDHLAALVAKGRAEIRTIPVLRADAFAAMAARDMPLDRIVAAEPETLTLPGIAPTALLRSVSATRGWMKGMYAALLRVVLATPQKATPQKAAAKPAGQQTDTRAQAPRPAAGDVQAIGKTTPISFGRGRDSVGGALNPETVFKGKAVPQSVPGGAQATRGPRTTKAT